MSQNMTEIDSTVAVTPWLYRQNAFRLTGLSVTASSREVARFLEQLKVQEKIGVAASTALGVLPLHPPPDIGAIRDAVQTIQKDPEIRLFHEFFWLWPLRTDSSQPDPAFTAMTNGKPDVAAQIYQELILKHGTEATIARHNLAVLHHIEALDLEWQAEQQALTASQQSKRDRVWKETLTSWKGVQADTGTWEWMVSRVQTINDPRLTNDAVERLRAQLPLVLCLTNATLAIHAARRGAGTEAAPHLTRLTAISSESDLRERAILSALQPIRNDISAICERSEEMHKHEPDRGSEIVTTFLEEAKPLIEVLDQLLPEDHLIRTATHDQVATMALELVIAYGTKSEEWAICVPLLEQCLTLASGEVILNRLKENLQAAKNNREHNCCWACGNAKADPSAAATEKLYNNVCVNGNRIEWNTREVTVPRCLSCASAFKNMEETSFKVISMIWILSSILSFLVLFFGVIDHSLSLDNRIGLAGLSAAVLGIVVAIAAVLVIGETPQHSYWHARGHSSLGIKEYPEIQRLLNEGWKMGAKPPNV